MDKLEYKQTDWDFKDNRNVTRPTDTEEIIGKINEIIEEINRIKSHIQLFP